MINQKQKGSRGERELAEWLRENGCPSARRTQQYCGTEGTSDVTVEELSHWHIEHKATKSAKIAPSMLKNWFKQVRTDCPAGKLPVIINTANGRERIAILPLTSVDALYTHLDTFKKVRSNYVDTIAGNACDFSKELTLLHRERRCLYYMRQPIYTEQCSLVGAVTFDDGKFVDYFTVMAAMDWLTFAKEYRLKPPIASEPAQIDDVQKFPES